MGKTGFQLVMEGKRGEEVGDRGEGLSKKMHQQAWP